MNSDTNANTGVLGPVLITQHETEDLLHDLCQCRCREIYESKITAVNAFQRITEEETGDNHRFVVVLLEEDSNEAIEIRAKFHPDHVYCAVNTEGDHSIVMGLMERADIEYVLLALDSNAHAVLIASSNVPAVVIADRGVLVFPRQ